MMLRLLSVMALAIVVLPRLSWAEDYRIATWNLEWFFDEDPSDDSSQIGPNQAAPSKEEYQSRVKGFANAIADINPDVMALEEIENEKVVRDLATQLKNQHQLKYAVAFVQGKDTYTGQDVAFLVREGLPIDKRRCEFDRQGMEKHKDLSKHLLLTTEIGGEEVALIAVHLSTRTNDRKRQARTLREWAEEHLDGNLIILGDFNAGQKFNQTTPDSEIGIIRGFQTEDEDDDLFDVDQKLGNRTTHVSGKEFDRILLSPSLVDEKELDFKSVETRCALAIRGEPDQGAGVDYDFPEDEQDLSDHFPLIVTLTTL